MMTKFGFVCPDCWTHENACKQCCLLLGPGRVLRQGMPHLIGKIVVKGLKEQPHMRLDAG